MPVAELIVMFAAVIQIMVLAVLLPMSVKLVGRKKESLTAVFLSFCYALWLFTDLYWVIYDIARPESRMPFAANEIGEATVFLMMAAALGAVIEYSPFFIRLQPVAALLFAACNVALWIAWSGEWVEDILVGAIFAYLLYSIVASLKAEEALKAGEWTFTGLICLLLLLSQGLGFSQDERISAVSENCGYGIMVLLLVFWMYKCISAMRKKMPPGKRMALSFALVSWAILSKYMSAGSWYIFFLCMETLGLPFMYLAVRKAVEEA